jgi:hypothetical protein
VNPLQMDGKYGTDFPPLGASVANRPAASGQDGPIHVPRSIAKPGIFSFSVFQPPSEAHSCADVHSAETMVSVCRVGLKVMDGGGFAASLDEFSKAWAIYFPDVVSSKSKKVLTKM